MTPEATALAARLREPPYSSSSLALNMAREIDEQHTEQAIDGIDLLAAENQPLRIAGHSPPTIAKQRTLRVALATTAFQVPELLVLILSHISPLLTLRRDGAMPYEAEDPRSETVQLRANDLWTLVQAQRVNRSFRDLVRSTHFLQQCLFYTPQTNTSASWIVSPSSSQPLLNPLIQTVTHWRFSHLPPEKMQGRFSAHMVIERSDLQSLCSLPVAQQGMLLSQPPVSTLTAMVWERTTQPENGEARVMPPSSFYSVKRIQDDGGITLGKVLDRVGLLFTEDDALKAVKLYAA